MKKLALALLASLALSTGAQALETGVAPKVTELGVSRKLFKNPRCQAGWNKNVLFGFS